MNRKHLIHTLQLIVAKLGIAILPRLPRPIILLLATIIGRLIYLSSKKLRRVGDANLQLVYGDTWSKKKRNTLLKQVFRNYTLNLLDFFWFMRHPKKRMQKHITIEPSAQATLQQKKLVIMTGHFGNWELIGKALSQKGMPLHSIAAALENPRLNKLFIDMREATGQKIIPQKGAIRALLRALKNQENVAMLLDQNTLPRSGGLFLPFFGLPVPVSSAPAAIIQKTRCNVVTGYCRVDPKGHYHAYTREHITPDQWEKENDPNPLLTITGIVTHHMEQEIRRHPDQWLWMYKRWKYYPSPDQTQGYPPYARNFKKRED